MIQHVAEINPQVLGHDFRVKPHEPVADIQQRRRRIAQPQQAAFEIVQARHRVAMRAVFEDVFLQFFEQRLVMLDDRHEVVYDQVEDRIKGETGIPGEEAGCSGFGRGRSATIGGGSRSETACPRIDGFR